MAKATNPGSTVVTISVTTVGTKIAGATSAAVSTAGFVVMVHSSAKESYRTTASGVVPGASPGAAGTHSSHHSDTFLGFVTGSMAPSGPSSVSSPSFY